MRPNRLLTAGAMAALALAGSLHAQKLEIKTNHDPKANFAAIKTFAWLPPAPMVGNVAPGGLTNPTLSQEAIQPHLMAAVERELKARGLTEASKETADVHVVYFAALTTGVNQTYLGEYYGYVTGYASPLALGYTPSTSSTVYERGTIIIDIVDRAAKRAIWHGSIVTRVVQERTMDKRIERIDEAARRVFEKYPVKAKK